MRNSSVFCKWPLIVLVSAGTVTLFICHTFQILQVKCHIGSILFYHILYRCYQCGLVYYVVRVQAHLATRRRNLLLQQLLLLLKGYLITNIGLHLIQPKTLFISKIDRPIGMTFLVNYITNFLRLINEYQKLNKLSAKPSFQNV